MKTVIGTKTRLEALTSLRFFAALAVFLFHVPYVLPSASGEILSKGAFGVSFFFVLSGFIMAYSYPPERMKSIGYYFKRRFVRLYPIHFLLFVIWCILFFNNWGNSITDKLNSGIPNIILINSLFAGPLYTLGYNAVSWSLSVEVFFYLLFPILMRPKIAVIYLFLHFFVALLLSNSVILNIETAIPNFFYFNPIARTAEFAIGIISCHLFYQLNYKFSYFMSTVIEITSLSLVFIGISNSHLVLTSIAYPLLGILFAVAIIAIALEQGFVARLLKSSPLVLLGNSSFSFYMSHHMWMRIAEQEIGPMVTGIPLLFLTLFSGLILSIVLYKFFEKPVERYLIRRFNWRQ